MDTQLKKGILEIYVLSLLLQHESYGYELISNVSRVESITNSTIYSVLKRLSDNGYITTRSEEHNGRLRKYYCITPSGEAHIDSFIIEWNVIDNLVNEIKINRSEQND